MRELLATRQAFGEELAEIMERNARVVALTADLGESLRMLKVREAMPDRFFDVGVAEANMAGMAAGLALAGYVPVMGTFAVFLTRAFDHIRVQICQNNLPVVIVGSHGGVSNAADGGSAHALEDIAYFRALPNLTIIFPTDAHETRLALRAATEYPGPVYLRLYREPTPVLTRPDTTFIIGAAQRLWEGNDVTIIGTGPAVAAILDATPLLLREGISAEVVSVPTIKPLDSETILRSVAKTKRVVTVEDHSVNGGLGSAIAELLSEQQPTRLLRIGVHQFGESGTYAALTAKLGIDPSGITKATAEFVRTVR